MPQELLRDVFRSSDASGRARRRWSMLPISIAAHAFTAAAIVIVPLVAEVELPKPASPPLNVRHVAVSTPPAIAAPSRRAAPIPRAVSTEATTAIPPEIPVPEATGTPYEVPGAISDVIGVPSSIGETSTVAPPEPSPPPPAAKPPGPVRISNGVREPKKLVDSRPVYPAIAQAVRIEGTVILEAVIDERGVVDRLRVVKSIPLLDAAAIEAVRQWRYAPTLLSGVPVPILLTITIDFKLH
jgi:periplasmic protein TonB